MNNIKEVAFDKKLMATTIFSKIDYKDCFEVKVDDVQSIDTFARHYFLAQPRWLSALSFQVFSKRKLLDDLDNTTFQKEEKVGEWKVYGRDEREIAFGQDMGFMEYVCTFHLESSVLVKVATVVQFKGSFAKYYFSLVKLMHKPFLRYSLKNTQKKYEIKKKK